MLGSITQRSGPFEPGPPFVSIHQSFVGREGFFRQVFVYQHRLDGYAARVDRLAEAVVAVGHLDVGEHDIRIFDVAVGRARIGLDGFLELFHRIQVVGPLEIGVAQHPLAEQVQQAGRLLRLQILDQDLELILGLAQLPLNLGLQLFACVVGLRFLEFLPREHGPVPQRFRQKKAGLGSFRTIGIPRHELLEAVDRVVQPLVRGGRTRTQFLGRRGTDGPVRCRFRFHRHGDLELDSTQGKQRCLPFVGRRIEMRLVQDSLPGGDGLIGFVALYLAGSNQIHRREGGNISGEFGERALEVIQGLVEAAQVHQDLTATHVGQRQPLLGLRVDVARDLNERVLKVVPFAVVLGADPEHVGVFGGFVQRFGQVGVGLDRWFSSVPAARHSAPAARRRGDRRSRPRPAQPTVRWRSPSVPAPGRPPWAGTGVACVAPARRQIRRPASA